MVARDDQIEHAWSQLPRLVRRIPPHLRDERIVRACIAVATGLFDAAINYIWNAAVLALREKVRDFGLHVIPDILDDRSFDEASLVDLKDAELLELCHKLNLITGRPITSWINAGQPATANPSSIPPTAPSTRTRSSTSSASARSTRCRASRIREAWTSGPCWSP